MARDPDHATTGRGGDLGRDAVAHLLTPPRHDDIGAAAGERVDDLAPEATSTAGDDHNPVLQFDVHDRRSPLYS